MRPSVHVGFFDRPVPAGSHICAFYGDPATRDEIVMPFLAHSLRTGEKCGAEMPMEVLRTHPVAVVNGTLHANPYYVPRTHCSTVPV
jgi:hypothetical protein